MTAGEWVRFSDIDFGEPGQFDQIEFLQSRNEQFSSIEGVSVQLWIDGPDAVSGGTLLAELDRPIDQWQWFRQRATTPEVSGTHDLYVRVEGANAANLAISAIRLLKQDVLEEDQATITFSSGGVTSTAKTGESVWLDRIDSYTFRTGPTATTATITVTNTGRTDAYFDRALLAEGNLIPADPENLAFGNAVATQSSTAGGLRADQAIDGETGSFSRTQDAANSWWQAGFAQKFGVGQIELFNVDSASYGDLSNFTVSVWDGEPNSGGVQLWSKSFYESGSVDQGGTFSISGNEIADDGVTRLATAFGNHVRVQLNGLNNNGNGVLSLAEVRIVDSSDVAVVSNLARSGVAEQSSDLRGGWDLASFANNGLLSPADVISTTERDAGAWWQVDLGQAEDIDQIVLFNRAGNPNGADRLRDFRVSVWDADPEAGGSELWGRNYDYSNSAPPISTSVIGEATALRIDGGVTGSNGIRLGDVQGGQYVRVQLNGTNILSLAEVQVWGNLPTPGDFDRDSDVDGQDLAQWQGDFGLNGNADADFDGDSDGNDFLAWQRNYQAPIVTVPGPLIDETLTNGNSGLLTTTTAISVGQATTSESSLTTNDNGRALVSSSANGDWVQIPGWRTTRVSYPGSNPAFGFDGADALQVGTESAQYAFVNSGVITLVSDPIAGSFAAGDTFDLSYWIEGSSAAGQATATLNFNTGESHTFSTIAADSTAAQFADSYTLLGDASSVVISIVMDTVAVGNQFKLDSIGLDLRADASALSQELATAQDASPVEMPAASLMQDAAFALPLTTNSFGDDKTLATETEGRSDVATTDQAFGASLAEGEIAPLEDRVARDTQPAEPGLVVGSEATTNEVDEAFGSELETEWRSFG